jgi:hypothetical protein
MLSSHQWRSRRSIAHLRSRWCGTPGPPSSPPAPSARGRSQRGTSPPDRPRCTACIVWHAAGWAGGSGHRRAGRWRAGQDAGRRGARAQAGRRARACSQPRVPVGSPSICRIVSAGSPGWPRDPREVGAFPPASPTNRASERPEPARSHPPSILGAGGWLTCPVVGPAALAPCRWPRPAPLPG